jgi:tRNA A-37 threonylcarbamoyl transferase component Bud32/tetratricopeptide (TPR) repeat protein
MSIPCPVTEHWERMLADELLIHEEEQLEEHLQDCYECRQRLDLLTEPDTQERVGAILQVMSQQVRLPAEVKQKMLSVVTADKLEESNEVSSETLPAIPGYEVLSRLGQGGSSLVYSARDTKLQRTVAIKLLREKATPVQRQRFHREAQSLASLQHENVAKIYDVSESGEQPYLILEYISGGSLAQYLQGDAQTAPTSARLVLQLASAIQKAHETGFIHRDLKPGNILLEPHFGSHETTGLDRFVPKVIDFGIAKELHPVEHLTNTRDFLGTPSYMAPEQITQSGQWPTDHRMDVYALGIILYEMLTGRPPFRAVSPIDTMLQIKHEEPVPPTRFEPTVPRDLENICLKCIEKDPNKRYASAQALANDLVRFLDGKPVQARPISRMVRAWRWSKRNPGWAIAASLIFLMLLTAAIVGPLLAHREHQLREEAAFQAKRADIEGKRARENLNTAGKVLEEMLDRLLTNMRLEDPAYEDVQKGMVTFAIPYLEQFVQHDSATDVLLLRQARSLLQLAMVQKKNKQLDKAEGNYWRAQKLITELIPSETVSEVDLLKALASVHMEFGRFQHTHLNQDQNSEKSYRTSLSFLDKLAERQGIEKCYDSYAIVYSLLASSITNQRERAEQLRQAQARSKAYAEGSPYVEPPAETTIGLAEEERYYLLAIDYRHKLMELHNHRDDMVNYAAMTHMNAAIFYRRLKDQQKEINELRKALELAKKVNHSKSIWLESPFYLSTLQGELGIALLKANQREEGLEQVRQAKKISDALVISYPSSKKYGGLSTNWEKVLKHYAKPTAP